jgi:hypothetical protein
MLAFDQDTPILLLVFNRPELTQKVFDSLKKVAPKRLYIAADGPRSPHEQKTCLEVRNIVTSITWPCELKTLFRDQNLGCGRAVSEGITWFFEQEEEGIILEDDCLPTTSFFSFASTMLEYFRDNEQIGHISGSNFQDGQQRGDGTYYFSGLTHVWGWAGWRRVWAAYDFKISSFPKFDQSFAAYPSHQPYANKWKEIFTKVYQGEIDTWDYQYAYLNLQMDYKAVMPNVNLIENIGIGIDATHTDGDHPLANKPTMEITEIIHPTFMFQNVVADMYTQRSEFEIPIKKKNIFSRTWKKIKNR